jgi:hypothetical protein
MEQTEKAKVLSRVRKMLNLANDAGASEGERDNAMRMAHATLAKYNMTITEAETSGANTDEPRGDLVDESVGHLWVAQVMNSIAQLYFCTYYRILRAPRQQHHFIGRESNAVTAKEIGTYVWQSIRKEAAKQRREQFEDANFERSFCKGAARRVHERCFQLRQDAERASQEASKPSSTGTALVLASVYKREQEANAVVLLQQGIRIRKGRGGSRNTTSAGASAGRAFGDKVSLNRQVSGGSSNKRLN